jgi:hypothetical protein
MVEPFQKCPAGALSQAALISPETFGRAMPHPHTVGPELFYHLKRARPGQRSQFSTRRSPIRENSRSLAVTTV